MEERSETVQFFSMNITDSAVFSPSYQQIKVPASLVQLYLAFSDTVPKRDRSGTRIWQPISVIAPARSTLKFVLPLEQARTNAA